MGNSPSSFSSGEEGGVGVAVGSRSEREAGGNGVVSSRGVTRTTYGHSGGGSGLGSHAGISAPSHMSSPFGQIRTTDAAQSRSSVRSTPTPPPWLDYQLPEPEKYRDFQSGPTPTIVPPLIPSENMVYNLVDEDEEDVCPTCLEEYGDDNPKITAQCGHSFHLSCMLEWMNRSDKCPFFCEGKLKCPEIDFS